MGESLRSGRLRLLTTFGSVCLGHGRPLILFPIELPFDCSAHSEWVLGAKIIDPVQVRLHYKLQEGLIRNHLLSITNIANYVLAGMHLLRDPGRRQRAVLAVRSLIKN
jgi:hypothetical protein